MSRNKTKVVVVDGQKVVIPPKPKAPTIAQVMMDLFETKKGQVSLDEALKAAKAIKPDTCFKKTHLYYYKKAWEDKKWEEQVIAEHKAKQR